jgi:hypothetical protein
MYLLDTVVSEMRRRTQMAPAVAAWAASVPAGEMYLSVLTLMELESGALLIGRRDPEQGRLLTSWIERNVLRAFDGRILAIDLAVARHCAPVHVPAPRAVKGCADRRNRARPSDGVVTRNVRDFGGTGASVLNPWEWPV